MAKTYYYGEMSFNGENWQFETDEGVEEYDGNEITVLNRLGRMGYRVLRIEKDSEDYPVYLLEKEYDLKQTIL